MLRRELTAAVKPNVLNNVGGDDVHFKSIITLACVFAINFHMYLPINVCVPMEF